MLVNAATMTQKFSNLSDGFPTFLHYFSLSFKPDLYVIKYKVIKIFKNRPVDGGLASVSSISNHKRLKHW